MVAERKDEVVELALAQVGERYGNLRLCHPQAEARMVDSLRQFGQVFPVVVTSEHELIDGFKRVRALRQLGAERVTARVLEVHAHAHKAAMLDLNRIRGALCELEEGLVVHSLCREDGLSQVEVATLLGRHKSWVCRRLSLIERLCEEALDHIRLGLIGKSIGRDLCRLPRGNQPAALQTILKHRLCCRETARLVSMLLARPRWDWPILLGFPIAILSERVPNRGSAPLSAARLAEKILDVNRRLSSLSGQCGEGRLRGFTPKDWGPIGAALAELEKSFLGFKTRIERRAAQG